MGDQARMQAMMRMMFGGGMAQQEVKVGREDPNVKFYFNEITSMPDGAKIDDMHRTWAKDYERLEMHHGYIQWLFPVFENAGMNFESQSLSKEGAALIRADETAQRRVIESYRLMLGFYGLILADERTGRVERDPDSGHCNERLNNLNESSHNWLRISRIITSLGELGFHRYKRPFLERLRVEVEDGALADAASSYSRFWQPLVEQEDSPGYAQKTLEEPTDRAEGCLFQAGGALAD